MNRFALTAALALTVCLFPPARAAGAAQADASDLKLWYTQPAAQWVEALPVGNGSMGAMVFGGVTEARWQFNEDTLWAGRPRNYCRPDGWKYLPAIRQAVNEKTAFMRQGKTDQAGAANKKATQLLYDHFMSDPIRQSPYVPFGDLRLTFKRPAGLADADATATVGPSDYRRQLDLHTAVATTTYRLGDVTFTRRTFASYPDRVIVIELSASRPGSLNFSATLTSPHTRSKVQAIDAATLRLAGQVNDNHRAREPYAQPSVMRFEARLNIRQTGGTCSAGQGQLIVRNADHATLRLVPATSFKYFRDVSADPAKKCRAILDRLAGKPADKILADHLADYRHLFDRVAIDLGHSRFETLPTDQRLARADKSDDPQLTSLLFQFGRYLLIASSRPGCQPANLQGLWNDKLNPPWESKYTTNINVEMNYWPAEVTNLSECHQPLFDAMDDLAVSGGEAARMLYHARGWVIHHNFDLWRGAAPINSVPYGVWPTGAAWLATHLWEHYLFGRDERFLRTRAYPLMKGAALFWLDALVEDPATGLLVTNPSCSPENGGLCAGPAMDRQIIRALFGQCADAAKILNVDEDLQQQWRQTALRIAPDRIGRFGQLQEWLIDRDNPDSTHRHISHLWALYPGNLISADTPKLNQAAKVSLLHRGDSSHTWALAWRAGCWARLHDGNHAYAILMNFFHPANNPLRSHARFEGGIFSNFFSSYPPFQIDGNFGATAAIAEMLVQSHRTDSHQRPLIELLAALPDAWRDGSVSGLRARGGFDIDIAWRHHRLTGVVIRSSAGLPATVRYGKRTQTITPSRGEVVKLDANLQPR